MGKRKTELPEETELTEEVENVVVDFDFFDLRENDFLTVKNLVRQLLGPDNIIINLSSFTQLILESKCNSAVKAGDQASDPFAIISVIDIGSNRGNDVIEGLINYWYERSASNMDLHRSLRKLFSKRENSPRVGLVISERLLNMPTELMAPMYKILKQELDEAKIEFDHLIIPSKAYTEAPSSLDAANTRRSKKGPDVDQLFFFHPEDEIFQQYAVSFGSYHFKNSNEETDSKRVFQEAGICPLGYLTILKYKKIDKVVKSLGELAPIV